tara:strand:- start:1035 stop:1226 length:192 start_codon:yes stop_codon:yes gene_type:complete
MNAKQLYKKHLKICTPDGYQSEKQMEMYRSEAAINAIDEVLDMYQDAVEELHLIDINTSEEEE